ncbi:MAG: hypothetical protein J6A43_06515, partial [Clostridia bacterium]|nr:hypothetical protein [Clostridia bacterium]
QNEKFIQRFGYSAGQMKFQNILAFPLFHLTTAPTLRESSLYNMKIKNKCEKLPFQNETIAFQFDIYSIRKL